MICMLAVFFIFFLIIISPFLIWLAVSVPGEIYRLELTKFLLSYIGTPFTACVAIIAWAYLRASSRLGIVDLFACEISTLCRVGTIVDVATQYVGQYGKAADGTAVAMRRREKASTNFVSEENYFPVFASNSKDLQVLEAEVVIDITAFYTYMKATRDTLRKLSSSAATGFQPCERDAILETLMKMLFLGFESGRKAVQNLIEYEPVKTDVTIIILLTELKCFSFLMEHEESIKGAVYERIKLRRSDYNDLMKALERKVALGLAKCKTDPKRPNEWEKAEIALRALKEVYKKALAAANQGSSESIHKAMSGKNHPSLETVEGA